MKGFARLATVVAISSSLLSLSACQSTPINERPTILEPIQGNGLKKVSAYTKKDLSKIRALLKTTPHNSSIDFAVKDITTGVVMDSFMVNPNSFNPQQQQPIEFSITTNQQMLIVTMPGVKWYEIIYNPSYDPSNQTPVNLTFYWDGRDEDDNFVAPGNYTVRASQMTGLTAGVPYQPFCPTYVIFDETSQSYNPYCSDQGIVRETTVGVVTGLFLPQPQHPPLQQVLHLIHLLQPVHNLQSLLTQPILKRRVQ